MVNFFVHIELRIVINSNVSKISEIVNLYITLLYLREFWAY